MSERPMLLSAAFRKLFVEAGLFTPRVVVEDLFLAVFWQGFVRVHIGLIAAWNRRYPATQIDRWLVWIRSGAIRHWNRLKIHLWRACLRNGFPHWFAAGFSVFRFAHQVIPFLLESEPTAVGNVPFGEAF